MKAKRKIEKHIMPKTYIRHHSYSIRGLRTSYRMSQIHSIHPAWGPNEYVRKVFPESLRDNERRTLRSRRRVRSLAGRWRQIEAEGRSCDTRIKDLIETQIWRALDRGDAARKPKPKPRRIKPKTSHLKKLRRKWRRTQWNRPKSAR